MKRFIQLPIYIIFYIMMFNNTHASSNEEVWNLSTPESKGINSIVLKELHNEFKNSEHGYIDSFLVIKDGDIVFEKYYQVDYFEITKDSKHEQAKIMQKNYGTLATPQYNYFNPDWHPFYKDTDLHTIQSVSKSVTSALIGIAIERGAIDSLETKIIDFFPQYKHLFNDKMKRSITIRDLLTMTAGIKWDEFSYAYTDPLNDAATMENSHDWVEYILSLPMEYQPGSKFVYNSGITILLSNVLQEATKMQVEKYAEKYLFGPLGIQNYYWKKTPTGLTDTEGGLYLSSRDFAKIGLLYLNDGVWNDQQILREEWVKLTMSPDILIEGSSRKYGFQWWFIPFPSDHSNSYKDGEEKWIFSGSGYGGQYLLIIPEHDLVVVFNGWNVFDIPRPTIEYLSERVLKSIY